jgi:hypothetical protein
VRRLDSHWRALGLALVAAVLVAACSSGDDSDDAGTDTDGETAGADEPTAAGELPEGYDGYASETYADDAHWLCKPGIADDVCSRNLDATAVAADGSTEVQPHDAAEHPPVDCFYVYPTTSRDQAANSDLVPGEPEEIYTAYNQVARLNSTCRIFAPVYRQVTLAVLGGLEVPPGTDARAIAYDDVVDAFKHYVANESDGRGVVLIGHSQGAGILTRLIADEIDGESLLRDRLVSAYILGSSLAVPEGEVVGGDFDNVPLCESDDQTGCVVSYASFRSTAPPGEDSFFGATRETGEPAACVNPADLTGGRAPLHPYFLVAAPDGSLLGGTAQPFADPARTGEITTPWVTYPDFVEAECASTGTHSYLSLIVNGDASDPRTDDIGGDLTPEWGMHLIDANVAMGDIEALVARQAEAYVG